MPPSTHSLTADKVGAHYLRGPFDVHTGTETYGSAFSSRSLLRTLVWAEAGPNGKGTHPNILTGLNEE